MSKLPDEILTLQKMSGSVSTTKSLSGNVGAKTINIGAKGDDGATFVPSVSDDGVISWTNDKELPNPEPVNIKGVKGDKGDNGEKGNKGDKGDKGDKGERGEKGDPFTYADFTPEQIAGIAQQATEILQPEVNQLKSDLANLENLLIQIQDKLNQGTVVDQITVNEINDMIVAYFENKTVSEVDG